ncbi:Uncharacterized protein SAPIO_CDS7685 [Scedosporium apiospermum]|uniref:C2H2-type domain-containing protein n=1 Tax=Pseudallescheria apiosperma TaxID=563466 RepID=A0A084G2G4_PSEDA|nr:Uncharacterized protein SAPIO_CDS7685 [Scedosporium apiospermum]KEZ41526.1 Uncharacterized protein SAPIO_CDS7685 [Scedosporium apiospermum]
MKRLREPEDGTGVDAQDPEVEQGSSPAAKLVDLDSAVLDDESTVTMKCSMPPHKDVLSFRTYEEYETHYNKAHLNRCLECDKNMPSEHLLNVHIEECHDAFVAVKRDRGEHTYSCFVEGCERKCRTPQKRRLHLIDKHMYPKNFFFALTREGIDGRRSLLLEGGHRRRRSSANFQPKDTRRRASLQDGGEASRDKEEPLSNDNKQPAKKSSSEENKSSPKDPDDEMEDLTGAMSALQFVPTNIRFGRGGGRAGFSKR